MIANITLPMYTVQWCCKNSLTFLAEVLPHEKQIQPVTSSAQTTATVMSRGYSSVCTS